MYLFALDPLLTIALLMVILSYLRRAPKTLISDILVFLAYPHCFSALAVVCRLSICYSSYAILYRSQAIGHILGSGQCASKSLSADSVDSVRSFTVWFPQDLPSVLSRSLEPNQLQD